MMGIRTAVRDLEFHREGLNKMMGGSLGLSASANEGGDCSRNVWIRDDKKTGDPCAVSELQNDVHFKFGCSKNSGSIWGHRGMSDLTVCRKGLIDFGVGKDGEIKNCMQLGLVWSVVVNTFSQALATPSLMGNKMFQIGRAAGGGACLKSDLGATAASLACKQYKKIETTGELVWEKDEKHRFSDLFDHVGQILHTIHQNMIVNEKEILTGYSNFVSKTSLAAKENRLFHNLRFAKIGDPPTLCMVEVIYALDEQSDVKITGKAENVEPSSSRMPSEDVHSSPEYMRSTMSRGSFSELTELGPQLEHPEKKELLPQRDSFRYTKSEAPAKEQTENVLKSALAGGFSCALSAFIMHPVDTVKTQVQASTLSLPEIISKLPQIGTQGLYRGIIPAVVGQFSSHGLRTGICETIKFILVNVSPTMPDLQVESMSSFCGTILGTTTRIPSEVLKQRLQAGLYKNLGEAIIGTWKQDGLKAFFRGTGATLCREIPFYVAGMGLYTESKKVVQRIIGRPLEPWEIIVVGAVSGGLAAVTTTPFDVIKTRMMIATGSSPDTMSAIALSILRQEGPIGLFKGAVPRFFWVAPLGAMNFAGYELARKALG